MVALHRFDLAKPTISSRSAWTVWRSSSPTNPPWCETISISFISEASEESEGASSFFFVPDTTLFLDLSRNDHVTLMGTEHMVSAIYTHFSAVLIAFLFVAVLPASVVCAPCAVFALGVSNALVTVFSFFALSIRMSDECTEPSHASKGTHFVQRPPRVHIPHLYLILHFYHPLLLPVPYDRHWDLIHFQPDCH